MAALGALAATLIVAAGPDAAPAQAACPHAGDTWREATRAQQRGAIECLIDRKRVDRGKHRLDTNRKLERAAQAHTETMLRKDCFKHRCNGEASLAKRIRRSGYLDGANSWRFAESFGCARTPRQMFDAWMDQRFHRSNMLGSRYRDIGVGVDKGAPDPARRCHTTRDTTFTFVVGWRRP